MRINRSRFIQHLQRLSCAGQCTEVVFTDRFRATALTPDHLLLIDVPEFEGAEPLAEAIGVVDVGKLIDALRLGAGKGNEGLETDVYLQDRNLVLDDAPFITQFQITAAPKTIATRIEPETLQKIYGGVAAGEGVPLDQTVLDKVAGAYSLYKAEQVRVCVEPEGVFLDLGEQFTHHTRSRLGETPDGASECKLLFGRHLIDVFSIVTDYSSAMLQVAGDNKPVQIIDGGYRYTLSPRKPAEPAKATGKGKKKAA